MDLESVLDAPPGGTHTTVAEIQGALMKAHDVRKLFGVLFG